MLNNICFNRRSTNLCVCTLPACMRLCFGHRCCCCRCFFPQFFSIQCTLYTLNLFIRPSDCLNLWILIQFSSSFSCCTAAAILLICLYSPGVKPCAHWEKKTTTYELKSIIYWCRDVNEKCYKTESDCSFFSVMFSVLSISLFVSVLISVFFFIDRSFIHVSKNTFILIHDTSHTETHSYARTYVPAHIRVAFVLYFFDGHTDMCICVCECARSPICLLCRSIVLHQSFSKSRSVHVKRSCFFSWFFFFC